MSSSKIDDKMARQMVNTERQKQLNLQLLAMKSDDVHDSEDEFSRKRTLATSRRIQDDPDMDGSDDELMSSAPSDEENEEKEAYSTFLASRSAARNAQLYVPQMAIAFSSLKNKKQNAMQ